MNELVFYRCEPCGNLIVMIENSGVIPECCGTHMTRLEPCSVDASLEKHVPVILQKGKDVWVEIGSIAHPMTSQHFIKWIIVQTDRGAYARTLEPDELPTIHFRINPDEDVIAAYAYCNLHGLWSSSPA